MGSRAKRRATAQRPARHTQLPDILRRGRRWFIGGGIAGAIVLLVVLTFALSGPKVTGGEVAVKSGSALSSSSDLPDFPITLYQGGDIVGSEEPSLVGLMGDKPLIINYWASNCPPCAAEMPEFERVWQRYSDRVLFVGLDVGRFFPGYGDQTQSKKELDELGITYVAGTPPSVDTVRQLEVKGLPSTTFVTTDGKVHRKWVGILNESKLTELVESLLDAS